MLGSPAESSRTVGTYPAESREARPEQLTRLLAAEPGPAAEAAWASFLDAYSGLLLRVARAFWPGYDGALDGYAYMLEELRRKDCQRLRKYAADGRGRFSTWLAVVARRLCLDQYRRRYGRFRGDPARRCAPLRGRRRAGMRGHDPHDGMAGSGRQGRAGRGGARYVHEQPPPGGEPGSELGLGHRPLEPPIRRERAWPQHGQRAGR